MGGPRSSAGGRGFRSAPRARTPAASHTPAPQSNGGGGGVMGGGSFVPNVFDGLAWGAGSSVGRRVVDFFAGPRTIRVVEAPLPSQSPAPADACGIHNQAFAECINNNGSDISRCQFYIDMLNHCRRQGSGSHSGIAAAATIA